MVSMNSRSALAILLAATFTISVVGLGYFLLGLVAVALFSLGFVVGFVMWIGSRQKTPFSQFSAAFYVTLLLFVIHKLEERYLSFFPELSKITGVPMPDTDSVFVVLHYLFAAAWFLIPYLTSRDFDFGYFLAWTFFASMGIVELAHFAFPFFTGRGFGYFPGMASAVLLVPTAWWGMRCLRAGARSREGEPTTSS